MRYSTEHKQETRTRILDAAARVFRREGYGGSGIEGLTKAAGVTNGAFYGHFKSKSEAFRTVVLAGLEEFRLTIAGLKAEGGKRWLKTFVDVYLGAKRTCDIGEACALPTFSPEMTRADPDTRHAYEEELLRLIDEVSSGLGHRTANERDERAIALLALLSGGVTLARAVPDPVLAERIAKAVGKQAMAMTSSAPSSKAK
ncbi:TetR/AcrR family transcriptional regulator [Dyella mobilis]|uniref:TetR/AcrR family transcriptional regulator n=1 Tax=Dyella mobilis TaxID=1849582 RepID=A0ABS2KLL2_9GAMM|nr:TetR/AcrR family transcriptional regulator [Dyella mobilis]MBM7131830.1 TetR/AcrR family transcriptional regulator [Dyella mobilis]